MTNLELRERIAVEVMGWERAVVTDVCHYPDGGTPEYCPQPIATSSYHWRDLCGWDGEEWCWLPLYESSIQAAWEVVEAMRAKGYEWIISNLVTGKKLWEIELMLDDNLAGFAQAETAPEVICKAALAAIRSDQ